MEGAIAWAQASARPSGACLAGQLGAEVRFVLAGVTLSLPATPFSNLNLSRLPGNSLVVSRKTTFPIFLPVGACTLTFRGPYAAPRSTRLGTRPNAHE